MTEVYEEFTELKINGREIYLVDHDDYYYKKAKSQGPKVTYVCESKRNECPGKILVHGKKIVWRHAGHNHLPDVLVHKAKETMSKLWHAAVETDCDIKDMVTDAMLNLSPEVEIFLPDVDRLRTNLKSARRAATKKKGATPAASKEGKVQKRKGEDLKEGPPEKIAMEGLTDLDEFLVADEKDNLLNLQEDDGTPIEKHIQTLADQGPPSKRRRLFMDHDE